MSTKLYQDYAQMSIEQVMASLQTSDKGLSKAEVQERVAKYGPNKLPEQKNAWWQVLLRQFFSPFIYLLLLIAVVTFVLQDASSGIIILACVLLNTFVGFYQEYKAEQSMQLLKQYLKDSITVIREGAEQELSAVQLVPGDIALLYPGDIIPADVRFIKADHVQVDEAVLTGESLPVSKQDKPTNGQKTSNIGHSGTTLISGKAVVVVIATGLQSTLGAIAALTAQTQKVSGFSLKMNRFSHFILFLIIGTVTLVFFAHLAINYANVSLINLAIFAIALGVTVIPEALPVVTSFGFTRGAMRLAAHKVVIKRLSAIEDLGSIQVLCTDKTGTLTENKLTIAHVFGNEQDVLFWGALGSGLSSRNLGVSKGFDAVLWQALSQEQKDLLSSYQKISELPFDPVRRRSLVLYKHDSAYELIVRGSPEDVLACCITLNPEQKESDVRAWLDQQGRLGHRIIAIGCKQYCKLDSTALDTKTDEHSMNLVGFVAFEDPLKKSAVHAIEKARHLGVQIKILSGDSPEVCAAIAAKVGLIQNPAQVIPGDYFTAQSYEAKKNLVTNGVAFARTTPEQKYEIIKLLQENYKVGYMGDGINDAPALKIAHVALAVDDAADIARDAADIILLQRSLAVIINGIQEGRVIFANTLKYIKITLAAGFGHFYALAIASLLIDFLPMLPAQLLVLNFLSDIPLIALSTDTVSEAEIEVPQTYDAKTIIITATILGLMITTFDFILFGLWYRAEPVRLQTNWFMSSILTELLFSFSARSPLPFYKAPMPSKPLLILSALVAGVTIAIPYTPFGQNWLHFTAPEWYDLIIIMILAIGCFIGTECIKKLYYRFQIYSGL